MDSMFAGLSVMFAIGGPIALILVGLGIYNWLSNKHK